MSVLVACDGDFLPLVRKLNTLGTRVMLLAWDFKYMGANGEERETRTAQVLLDEVTYPVMMHQVIDDRSRRSDPQVNALFVSQKESRVVHTNTAAPLQTLAVPGPNEGVIQSLKSGFGFITPRSGGANVFFFHTELVNADFNDMRVGNAVKYGLGKNDKGVCATQVHVVDASDRLQA